MGGRGGGWKTSAEHYEITLTLPLPLSYVFGLIVTARQSNSTHRHTDRERERADRTTILTTMLKNIDAHNGAFSRRPHSTPEMPLGRRGLPCSSLCTQNSCSAGQFEDHDVL